MSEKKNPRFTYVEDVLDVNDMSREWYFIDEYNGYEVSNDHYVRSMKHFKKYPFGLLLQPKKDKKGNVLDPEDPIYTLSNNDNKRCQVHLSKLLEIAKNSRQDAGYPRKTYMSDLNARNDHRIAVPKRSNEESADDNIVEENEEKLSFPSFTIIDEKSKTSEQDNEIQHGLFHITDD